MGKYCYKCEWIGDITECRTIKDADYDLASNSVIYHAVPICPVCGYDNLEDTKED